MAYTDRLTKAQLRQRRDATRDRSRDNTNGTVQYLVTYAYTNNNCLLCASNIIVSVAIPTHLSGGSFVRGFTCSYFSSTMTFLAEIEAVLRKRIGYYIGLGSPIPGVATPRGRHSRGDAVLLKYIHGRCSSAEIHTWAMLFCWSVAHGEVSPAFSSVFQFLLSCDLMWPDLYCVADLLNGCYADRV